MTDLIGLVMAAGHGTRMKSTTSKVLHPACGRPLVYFPIKAALDVGAKEVVVVVNPNTEVAISAAIATHFAGEPIKLAVQRVPQGTGDAVRAGLTAIELKPDQSVLILSGDTPLLQARDLSPLLEGLKAGAALSFLTFIADDPTGYGRVLRDGAGKVTEIREHKDLRTDIERGVTEVNAGVYLAQGEPLKKALLQLTSDNAQSEYYLTDIVPSIAHEGSVTTSVASREVLLGVNDRRQLREVETLLFERILDRLCESGVTVSGTALIDDQVVVGPDARIEDGVRLRGKTVIGAGSVIDVGSVIVDSTIAQNVNVKPYCVVTESVVEDGVQLGPFAHLRPGSHLEADCHIGNFVETKNTLVKKGAKANHLAYLGDAEIGEKSNLGAGTIICNYDGFQKQRTVIGKGVFVGSDSQLIAPVRLGDGAYVATGTTVTEDVPADALAIGRSRQTNKEGYAGTLRAKLKSAADAKKAAKSG